MCPENGIGVEPTRWNAMPRHYKLSCLTYNRAIDNFFSSFEMWLSMCVMLIQSLSFPF